MSVLAEDPWDWKDDEPKVDEAEIVDAEVVEESSVELRMTPFGPAKGASKHPKGCQCQRCKGFEPGNTWQLKHGARSERMITPVAQWYMNHALNDEGMPEYLRAPNFQTAVLAWARAEAKRELLEEWIAKMTPEEMMTPAKSGVKSPIEQWRVMDQHCRALRADLGMNPAAFAKIKKDMGIAQEAQENVIAKAMKRGADSYEARRRELE